MNKKTYITDSAEGTQKIAEDLAKSLRSGDFLAFYGNLGSGKTTFIQGLAKALGVKRRVISPTFIIVRTYDLKSKIFYHIDLYRTENMDDLLGLGLDQIINDKTAIVALEWAEKMGSLLPDKRYEITLTSSEGDKREIKIIKHD